MDEQIENIIIDEDLIDTEKNDLESYRIPTRRTESYSSYVPNDIYYEHNTENDPLLNKKGSKPSSKTCFRSMCALNANRGRNSVFSYLPVIFAIFVFSVMYGSFLFYKLKPEINHDLSQYGVLSDKVIVNTFLTHFLLLLLVVCYTLCMFKNPGSIPDTHEWSLSNKDINNISVVYETKRSGGRRSCKWCKMYKPDRTHHCRTCGTCILRMDHHCPWANNCIGWRNYKYFYLTILYSSAFSIYIAILLMPSIKQFLNSPTTVFGDLVVLIVAELMAIVLSLVLTGFLFFHTWLMCENFTTIEFCEKYSGLSCDMEGSIWSSGVCSNVKSVLGNNPLLWLIPYDNRDGDGVTFKKREMDDDSFDDIEQPIVEADSSFLIKTKDTKQFEPELGEESP